MYVGKKIQGVREKLGFMQSEFAARLQEEGVQWSRATLSKVERGERQVRLTEAPVVAKLLGLGVGELLPGGTQMEVVRGRVEWGYKKALDDLAWAKSHLKWATNSLKSFRLLEMLAAGDTRPFRVGLSRTGYFSQLDMVEQPVNLKIDEVLRILGVSEDEIANAESDAALAYDYWRATNESPEWFFYDNHLDLGHPWFKKEMRLQRLMELFSEKYPNVEFDADFSPLVDETNDLFDIEAEEYEIKIEGVDDLDLPESFTTLIKKRNIDDGFGS